MINALSEGLGRADQSGSPAGANNRDWIIQSVESMLRQALPTLIVVGRQTSTYFNEACRQLVMPNSALQGGGLATVAPSLATQLSSAMEAAWAGCAGVTEDIQLQVDRSEGSRETWVTAAVTPVGRDDQIHAVLCVFRDITEEKRLRQRLTTAETTLDALTTLAPLFLWRLDTRGVVRWMNERCQTYFGVTLAQAREEGWIGWLHPSERSRIVADWGRAVTLATPFESRHRLLGSDGVYRWFALRALPQFNAQGDLVEWHSAALEVVDAAPEVERHRLLWTADAASFSRHFLNVGPSCGWPDNLRAPLSWDAQLASVSADQRSAYRDAMEGLAAGRSIEVRYEIRNAEGQRFDVEDTAFPLVETDGSINRFIGESRVRRQAAAKVVMIDPARRGCNLRKVLESHGLEVEVCDTARRRVRGRSDIGLVIYCSNSTVVDILGMAEAVRSELPDIPMVVLGDPLASPHDIIMLHEAGVLDVLSYASNDQAQALSVMPHIDLSLNNNILELPSRPTKQALSRLSPRELEILEQAVIGGTSKTIGRMLGISPRTVDYHRGKALDKLGVKAVTQAVDLFTPPPALLHRRY